MKRWGLRLRKAIASRLPPPEQRNERGWLAFFLPWLLLASGLSIGLVSALPLPTLVGSSSFEGSLDPDAVVDVPFNETGYAYVELYLGPASSCGLRIFALGVDSANGYLEDGRLPDASQSLSCTRSIAVHAGEVVLFVFQNPSSGEQSYSLRADRFVFRQPYGLLGILAFAVVIVGAAAVIIRMLQTGIFHIIDDIAEEQDPVPYWNEEQEKR